MKAKLLKIHTENKHLSWNYGDDYADIVRHSVSEDSGWEEIDKQDFIYLQHFIEAQNKNRNIQKGFYYMLVSEEDDYTVSIALKDMVKKAEEDQKKYEAQQEELRKKAEYAKQQRVLKQKERLLKKLEKLNNEQI